MARDIQLDILIIVFRPLDSTETHGIVVSIVDCHAGDPGSNPGRGSNNFFLFFPPFFRPRVRRFFSIFPIQPMAEIYIVGKAKSKSRPNA